MLTASPFFYFWGLRLPSPRLRKTGRPLIFIAYPKDDRSRHTKEGSLGRSSVVFSVSF
jgi:hypothetical protein